MKTLILLILVPGFMIVIVRAELTPWRLFSPSEVSALRERISRLEQQAQQAGSATARNSAPGWQHDPNYRTPLEKTQIIGRPEAAKSRDR